MRGRTGTGGGSVTHRGQSAVRCFPFGREGPNSLRPQRQYVPHQLVVHLDEHANAILKINTMILQRAHRLPEEVIQLPPYGPEQLHAELPRRGFLRERLESIRPKVHTA